MRPALLESRRKRCVALDSIEELPPALLNVIHISFVEIYAHTPKKNARPNR